MCMQILQIKCVARLILPVIGMLCISPRNASYLCCLLPAPATGSSDSRGRGGIFELYLPWCQVSSSTSNMDKWPGDHLQDSSVCQTSGLADTQVVATDVIAHND